MLKNQAVSGPARKARKSTATAYGRIRVAVPGTRDGAAAGGAGYGVLAGVRTDHGLGRSWKVAPVQVDFSKARPDPAAGQRLRHHHFKFARPLSHQAWPGGIDWQAASRIRAGARSFVRDAWLGTRTSSTTRKGAKPATPAVAWQEHFLAKFEAEQHPYGSNAGRSAKAYERSRGRYYAAVTRPFGGSR